MAAENNASRSPKASPGPSSPEARDLSRAQIAQSLGAKDPSWFKQTSERETNSPANRSSRGDIFASDTESLSGRRQLPGMAAREASSVDVQKDGNSPIEGGGSRSGSPSRSSSGRDGARWSNHYSTTTSLSGFSGTDHRSPTHSLDRFRIPPPSQSENTSSFDEDDSFNSGKSLAMSPSQERISAIQAERSPSPTKGMGGFVQSAMLKRNDSVNKRWSAQTYTGLSRQNSIIGSNNVIRSNDDDNNTNSTLNRSNSRDLTFNPPSFDRSGSPSRASTSIRTADDFSKTADPGDDVFVKPSLPLSSLHSRSKSSVVSTAAASSAATGAASAAVSDKDDAVGRSNSRSSSPSKRWSPTKASWLENALKKPAESPKPKAMAPLQQPSWMAEISKTKAQRNSVDIGSAAAAGASASVLNFQKGGVGGSALADLKLHSKSSPAFPSLDIAEGQRVETETETEKKKMDVGAQEHQHEQLKEDTAKLESKKSIAKDPEREIQEYAPPTKRDDEASPSAKFDTSKASTFPDLQKSNVSNKPSTATIATAATTTAESRPSPTLHLGRTITPSTSIKPSVAPIPKSTEPNTISNSSDFRSVLKSRQAPSSSPSSNSDKKEFINVIGTLKRTQTKNYVAPDELKDNILRGKAALNVTGGPKKSERKDEFKESILRQKEAMRAKAEVEAKEGGGAAANGLKASKMMKMQEKEVPEALAKRNALGTGGVAGNAASVGAGISVGTSEIGKSSSINGQAEKRFGSGREAPTKIESAEKKDMAMEPKNVLSPTEKQPSPLKSSPSPSKEPPNNSKISCTPPESKTTLLAGLGDNDRLADNESLPSPSTKATKVTKVVEIEEKPVTAGTFRTNISSSRKVDPLENSSLDGMNSVKRSSVEEWKEKEGEQKASTLPSASIKVESPGLHGLKSPALEKASAPAGNVPVSSSTGKGVASSPLLSVGSATPLSGKAVATSPPPSAASGKLADRLNPALAGLIAKGIAHNNAAKSEPLLMKSEAMSQSETSTGVADSRAKELTHMTRGRARGPKRKPPTMTTTTTIAQQKHSEEPVTVTSSASVFVENHEKPDPVDDSATTSPKDRGTANSSSFLHSEASITPQSSLDEFQSPEPHMISKEENGSKFPKSTSTPPQSENLTTKSPHHDRDSYPSRKSITLSQTPQIPPVFSTEAKAAGRMSSSSSPSRSPSPRSKGSFQVHTPTSPLATQRFISGSAGEEGLGISTMPLSPASQEHQARQRGFLGPLGPKGPRDRDSKGSFSSLKDLDGQALRGSVEMPGSPSKTAIAMTGYKIPESPSKSATSITGQKIPDSASRSTTNMTGYNRSRSTSPTKLREWSAPPQKVDHHNVPSPGPGSPRSREAGDSSNNNGNNIFADYFDVTPVTPAHLLEHIDTQAILTSANPAVQGPKADAHKIRTISKQICEIRGDGKMDALPAQQEHVLYEQEMYVCSHTFASADGIKSTEVYLWAGAGVSESAVEDAQLFAKRVAKENGTKHLAIIRQGKETPNFFQALGGILITLRGTRTESRSRYMLCGRKHLGHVTFDEVDFALGSFCSGFPFLISSGDAAGGGGGKLLLWKGAGCNVEELGCARLISMDLGGGGSGGIIGEELSEIDEGHEPQSFFDMFASDDHAMRTTPATMPTVKKMPRSAEYWKLKANNHRYHVRLFRVEQQQHQQQQQSSSQTLSTDTQSQTQSRFQMGSLWPLRRPSWNNSASSSPPGTPNSKVGTPPLPRSPGQRPMSSSSSTSSSVPKTSIVEITPFNQSDLEPEDVYVLDAFFEIYM